MAIAALFVEATGVYSNRPDVEVWDERRDARLYAGPHRVVAHPPCQRWGRYWSGGPSAKVRRIKGDDDGCFQSAFESLCRFGGVLEHPEASHAWAHFGIGRPCKAGWSIAWRCTGLDLWTCCVEQGHYGHPARKKTWLLTDNPIDLIWGPSQGIRLDEGFHSKAEREAARAAGRKPIKRLSTAQNLATPPAFAEILLTMAR